VLSEPEKENAYTIYRWSYGEWLVLKGRLAEEIAVGKGGYLF
jgi:hypothetical protein